MSNFHVKEHQIWGSHIREYSNALVDHDTPPLLEIKQYRPKRNPNPTRGDVTLIFTGGIGFPKEVYEALFDDIEEEAAKVGCGIRAIWAADMYCVGASGLRNRPNLGDSPSWYDHSRDLIHMINHFHQDMPQPLIGMGHSMGGNQILHASLIHPNLFTSLIVIEPAVYQGLSRKALLMQMKSMARRKEMFDSSAEAEKKVQKNSYYRTWDPRATAALLKHGLVPEDAEAEESSTTKFSTSKLSELALITRTNFEATGSKGDQELSSEDRERHPDIDPSAPSTYLTPLYRPEPVNTLKRLAHVRPSVMYICGGKSAFSTPEMRNERLTVTGTGTGGSGGAQMNAVKEVVISGGAHTIPMDKAHLSEVAKASVDWIRQQTAVWKEKHEQRQRYWKTKDARSESQLAALDAESLKLLRDWDGKQSITDLFTPKMKL